MRSVKLLVAMAAIAALVAGPVLAEDVAPAPMATDAGASADAGKTTTKKHKGTKHKGSKHKKSTSTTTAPAQ